MLYKHLLILKASYIEARTISSCLRMKTSAGTPLLCIIKIMCLKTMFDMKQTSAH